MPDMKGLILTRIKEEITKSTGCTDPVGIAFATASAVSMLNGRCEGVDILLSKDVYRNSINVGIPGTEKRGVEEAAHLGILLNTYHGDGLNILSNLPNVSFDGQAGTASITVDYVTNEDHPLFIQAEAYNNDEQAKIVIHDDYDNIVEKWYNGELIQSNIGGQDNIENKLLSSYGLEELITETSSMNEKELSFLWDMAVIQKKSLQSVLEKKNTKIGISLDKTNIAQLEFPVSAMMKASKYVGALVEARMNGSTVTIFTTAGSGNIGITQFLGTLSVCEELNVNRLNTVRALGISSLVSVFIKEHMHRMTNMCGSAIGAASGIAAATAYLLNGKTADMVHAINSVIATNLGIVCDGAKESCAYKSFTAARSAIESGHWAVSDKTSVPIKNGIIADDINESIKYLGRVNDAMHRSNDEIIDILRTVNNS